MKKIYTILGLVMLSQLTLAQNKIHSVLILNEGRYDYVNQTQTIPVSIGKYDPTSMSYEKLRDIDGVRFASDLLIEGDYILIAADTALIKLDRYNYQELGRQKVEGIRKLAVLNDQIFVTRGEYLVNFDSYLQIFDLNDLSLINSLDTNNGPKYASEGLAVSNGKLFVAVNNAFDFGNELGFVGIYDPVTSSYGNEIQLPNNATNPDNIMVDGSTIYTLNNHSFDKSSISMINGSNASTSYLANVSAGCGTSALHEGKVLYQEMMEQTLYGFDPAQSQVNDSFNLDLNFYGLAVDPIDYKVYATTTDFVSNGALLVYDNWNRLDSISIGVSAGNIAFDVRDVSSVESIDEKAINVYPNPAKDYVMINTPDKAAYITLFSLTGQKLQGSTGNKMNLAEIPAGSYLIRVMIDGQSFDQKLMIQ